VQQMASLLQQNVASLSPGQVSKILDAFGSVEQAMLSLFMGISGGRDWEELYNLTKLAGEFCAFLFVSYMVFMWLSVTNVITSMFVEKAMKFAKPQMEEMMLDTFKDDLASAQELKALFYRMDADHSRTLNRIEFQEKLKDLDVQSYFTLKGISLAQADMFFNLLQEHSPDQDIDLHTFVTGCLRMRGYATNVDVMSLVYRTQQVLKQLGGYVDEYRKDMKHIHETLRRYEEELAPADHHVEVVRAI